jgi:hypothetical protein
LLKPCLICPKNLCGHMVLFGGQKQPPSRLVPAEIDAESALMQALAEAKEDLRPDDGEVEIPSNEEHNG